MICSILNSKLIRNNLFLSRIKIFYSLIYYQFSLFYPLHLSIILFLFCLFLEEDSFTPLIFLFALDLELSLIQFLLSLAFMFSLPFIFLFFSCQNPHLRFSYLTMILLVLCLVCCFMMLMFQLSSSTLIERVGVLAIL